MILVYGFTVIDSDWCEDGTESNTSIFTNKDERDTMAYERYKVAIRRALDSGDFEGKVIFSKDSFIKEFEKGFVNIPQGGDVWQIEPFVTALQI